MTEITVNADGIKQTQDSLGKFVKKPPLTEKLLKKPPFKFIHDIVKVVRIIIYSMFNRFGCWNCNKNKYYSAVDLLKRHYFVLNLIDITLSLFNER